MSLVIMLLSGCSDRDMIDLEEYVAKTKARENPHVDAIPEFRHIPSYFYEVQHMRDPFIPLTDQNKGPINGGVGIDESGGEKAAACPPPGDPHRVRVGLELVPLNTLQMVGTLEIDGTLWALITSSDNTIYRLKQGDYMGENYGEIINISETQIEVLEHISDGEGCWKEQITNLHLNN